MNKNILFLLLGAGLVLVLAVVGLNTSENQGSVEENEPIEEVEAKIESANANYQAVDQLDQVEIDSDIVYQSEVMNTETFLNRLSIDMGLDSGEAISLVSEQTNLDIESKNINGTGATFRVFSQTIHVHGEYSVNVHVYCQTQESDDSVEILNVIAANMFPNDKADSKAFGGSIFVNIEDSETIYYSVNGEFYEEGGYTKPEVSPSSDTMLSVSFVPDEDLSLNNEPDYCYIEGRMNIEGAH